MTAMGRLAVGSMYMLLSISMGRAFQSSSMQLCSSRRKVSTCRPLAHHDNRHEGVVIDGISEMRDDSSSKTSMQRRRMLMSMAAMAASYPLVAQAHNIEDLELGQGSWTALGSSGRSAVTTNTIPASFCTYLARFLINYDSGVATWWKNQEESVSLLPPEQQQRALGRSFGKFSASLQQALDAYIKQSSYADFIQRLLDTYTDNEAARHIGILSALIPAKYQPTGSLRKALLDTAAKRRTADSVWTEDLGALLPSPYHVVQSGDRLAITPPIPIFQVGLGEEFGQTATATLFGPLSSELLIRELPNYTPQIYTILGISGATGCALTHSLVIPLDVVKTKAQTAPDEYSDILQGATKIVREEGWSGLLTGAEATLAGYFWYGLSVYPSYTFFKRILSGSPWAVAHVNDIALIAGAMAAVVASLGLTPLEAARIRVVADPEKYKPLGLFGTLQVIADESALYAGLPSLLTRQVIFGSVKFLAFERACDAIYTLSPVLRDATWTALGVSLVAGGFSGALSSVVSQPADSVLTYVSKSNGNLGFLSAMRVMVEEDGITSLFRGLGSRCVWAGSIIAGQFLLYDVFRT
eukprot:CAMPEP_0176111940 /NCGR_PEP_ID=MMETSP0120_2-20121206/56214_1 /TAXON_ID=160619 /ORGANISM="Kryptoperidinium foliaceum, Strain CCMP 1326" /LENGTH=582 /DNA_ID=CAMNT_0017446161 /DNA_START=146 /DNA_END=1890 /DNA_ORIENTATION=+